MATPHAKESHSNLNPTHVACRVAIFGTQVAALKEAGGEALLFDWNEKGRPLWADTSESVQIIDTKARYIHAQL